MNIIAPIIYTTWLIAEILLGRLTKARQGDRREDQKSLAFLWITIAASCTIGGTVSTLFYWPLVQSICIQYAGLALLVLGMIIRASAILQLGRYFTVDVAIRQDHQIVDKGLYKYIRHPSYTGALLSFLGLGIFLNNIAGLPVIIIPITIAFLKRIQIEEHALTKQFGEAYMHYKARTWRLLPGGY